MAKKYNIGVTSRETRGNVGRMIKKFQKKVKKERIIEEVKDRKRYKKPSVKKKEKRIRAERTRMREERKRRKAQERRNRKK
jgi:ribosomal protein S21